MSLNTDGRIKEVAEFLKIIQFKNNVVAGAQHLKLQAVPPGDKPLADHDGFRPDDSKQLPLESIAKPDLSSRLAVRTSQPEASRKVKSLPARPRPRDPCLNELRSRRAQLEAVLGQDHGARQAELPYGHESLDLDMATVLTQALALVQNINHVDVGLHDKTSASNTDYDVSIAAPNSSTSIASIAVGIDSNAKNSFNHHGVLQSSVAGTQNGVTRDLSMEDDDDYEPFMSPNGLSSIPMTMFQKQPSHSCQRTDQKQDSDRHPVLRTHNLSPIAPRPAHVSILTLPAPQRVVEESSTGDSANLVGQNRSPNTECGPCQQSRAIKQESLSPNPLSRSKRQRGNDGHACPAAVGNTIHDERHALSVQPETRFTRTVRDECGAGCSDASHQHYLVDISSRDLDRHQSADGRQIEQHQLRQPQPWLGKHLNDPPTHRIVSTATHTDRDCAHASPFYPREHDRPPSPIPPPLHRIYLDEYGRPFIDARCLPQLSFLSRRAVAPAVHHNTNADASLKSVQHPLEHDHNCCHRSPLVPIADPILQRDVSKVGHLFATPGQLDSHRLPNAQALSRHAHSVNHSDAEMIQHRESRNESLVPHCSIAPKTAMYGSDVALNPALSSVAPPQGLPASSQAISSQHEMQLTKDWKVVADNILYPTSVPATVNNNYSSGAQLYAPAPPASSGPMKSSNAGDNHGVKHHHRYGC